MDNTKKESNMSVPLAIVVAGIVIALAIFFRGGNSSSTTPARPQAKDYPTAEINLKPLQNDDYTIGSPNAPITIIEYSDTECPFCKLFHEGTRQKVIDSYGKSGNVLWVFRHFPLSSIHTKAVQEAQAVECAGELGGNSKFFAYLGRIFAITPSNDGLDLNELPKIAEFVGLKKAEFEKCLNSGKHEESVRIDFESGINAGVNGTPATFIVSNKVLSDQEKKKIFTEYLPFVQNGSSPIVFGEDGKIVSVSGNIPFEVYSKMLDIILSK